jgi:hypothetical protein
MTMNTEQVVSTLNARLHGVKPVEEGILRGEKRYYDKAFAVFYVDVTGKIEERAKNLSEYQDRILGRNYFDSPNDLRWNSYLLLLAEKSQFEGAAFRSARATLEADRNYARKFVITPEELASRVDAQSGSSQSVALQSVDILTRWARILTPAGLNDIFGDGDIAPLIRGLAEEPHGQKPPARIATPKPPADDPIASEPLQKIRLERFRRYPKVTHFECGRVNLIRGVNGVGKTTLLEAIEYFYCGATRRPGVPKIARILGWLKNKETPIATSTRTPAQTFRNRALTWYGKLGLRGNPLPESFGIYNFLNTDAAVHLTTENDPTQREKDLATLLMGAEAARVWGRIQRVAAGVPAERRSVERQVEALGARLTAEQERLSAARSVARQSDELFAQLSAVLLHLGWKAARPTKQAALLSAPLDAAGLESILLSALRLPDLPAGVTLEGLATAVGNNQTWLERAEHFHQEFNKVEKGKHETQTALQERLSSQTDAQLLGTYVEAGYADELARAEAHRVALARSTRQIGGLNAIEFAHTGIEENSPLLATHRRLMETRVRDLAHAMDLALKFFDAFKAERSRADALAQDLRAIAGQILEHAPDRDSCPLCHTKFPPDELRNHMFLEVETGEAIRETELAAALSTSRKDLETAQIALQQLDQLIQFCRRQNLPEDQTTYTQAVVALEEATRQLEVLRIELDSTVARLRTLEANGFNSSILALLQQRIPGADAQPFSTDFVQSLLVANEKKLIELRSGLAKWEEQSSSLRSTFEIFLADCGLDITLSPQQTEEALRQRLANLRAAQNAAQSLTTVLTIEPTMLLASVVSALNVASGTQARLRLAVQSESAADSSIADAQKALDAALRARRRGSDALIRFRVAEQALDEVVSVHSLETVSHEVLKQNRAEVANIFERIHAPHEFKICASEGCPA